MNYRYNEEKKRYEYAVVGTWEDNHLELPIEEIVWPGPRLPDVPRSMCSVECTLGSRKDVNDENACCWVSPNLNVPLFKSILQQSYYQYHTSSTLKR